MSLSKFFLLALVTSTFIGIATQPVSYAGTALPTHKPAVAKPTVNKPVVSKPTVNKPVVSKPTVNKPVVSKPTVNKPVVSKPTVKKPAAKSTAKARPTVVSSPKPKVISKKVFHHYYYRPRPRISISPSPSPQWPPKGFASANGIYARIPTGSELVGILSSSADPTAEVNQCAPDPKNPTSQAVACGAILAASNTGCSWWEINSTVVGPDPTTASNIIPLGSLRTLAPGTSAHSISTIILVSGIPLVDGIKFTSITAKCWLTQTSETVPSDEFTPFASSATQPTPTDSTLPNSSPTPVASSPAPTPTN